jgi:hypothetical protein
MRWGRAWPLAVFCAGILSAEVYVGNLPLEHASIRYFERPLTDRASRLAHELESGGGRLSFRNDGSGYLASLLEHFGVTVDSQALVFSKTSFQGALVSPRNPRAIYFSDDVAVGFVRGGHGIEVAAVDPVAGVVFYTLDEADAGAPPGAPRLTRRRECLTCHQGPATLGVPGIFAGSVFPNAVGTPSPSGAIVTDHRTAFADRWGGWYVNGTHGAQRHRGNAVADNPAEPETLEQEGTQNLTSLVGRFQPAGYLSQVSDIVALLTFEHQTQMIDLITRIGWQARIGPEPSAQEIDDLVAYLTFAEEAPLQEPVRGVSAFTKTFPERGPRDHLGRSLRDFDLERRLFRYPLSYLIYSAAFDALPEDVLGRIYARLFDVLSGKDQSPRYERLSAADRRAVLQILSETKPNLPTWFHASGDWTK